MDMDEFKDLVVDTRLETKGYSFEQMGAQFTVADQAASKGIAGPPADATLNMCEFLNVLTRVSFWRLNPSWGEGFDPDNPMGDQDLVPTPLALQRTLTENVLPLGLCDDPPALFREKVMSRLEV